jgi:hypothetical protein
MKPPYVTSIYMIFAFRIFFVSLHYQHKIWNACTANSKVHVKWLALDFELTGMACHFLHSNSVWKLFI